MSAPLALSETEDVLRVLYASVLARAASYLVQQLQQHSVALLTKSHFRSAITELQKNKNVKRRQRNKPIVLEAKQVFREDGVFRYFFLSTSRKTTKVCLQAR